MTSYNSQVGPDGYRIQFETDRKENYKFVETAIRYCIDTDALRTQQERHGGNLDEKGGKPLGAKGSSLGENDPLTLDELRQMDGEPVFLVDLVHKSDPKVSDLWGGWIVFTKHDQNGFIPRGGGFFSNDGYGKTWLAYRRKPEEGAV